MIELMRVMNEVLQTVVFLAALFGAGLAYKRFTEDGRRQRQVTADALYQGYLNKAIEHPELSWPEGKFPEDDKRYPWLVAIMCNALSAQIECDPKEDMRVAMMCDLLTHETYFQSSQFEKEGGWKLFPRELKDLYDEARATRPCWRPSDTVSLTT